MKPPKFHVGQAVVVSIPAPQEDIIWAIEKGVTLPKPGPIYHVRQMKYDEREGWELLLVEIINPVFFLLGEVGFLEDHFAPVEELPAQALEELLQETLSPVTV